MLGRADPIPLIQSYGMQGLYVPDLAWQETYEPLHPVGSNLERLLKEEPFTMHAYWRALDRNPGGTASFFTIQYAFHLYPANDLSQNRVEVEMIKNADGENILCGPFTTASVENTDGLCTKLRELILNQDQINATFHIVENCSVERSKCNTEWLSVELLVFSSEFDPQQADASLKEKAKTFLLASNRSLPKEIKLNTDLFSKVMGYVGPLKPIFRLHQECLLGPQYRGRSEYHEREPVVATPGQQELVNFVTHLVGMGRVCQLGCSNYILEEMVSNGASFVPSRAADELRCLPKKDCLGDGYEFPIMFR